MRVVPPPDQVDLWRHRRTMAYWSLVGLFLLALAATLRTDLNQPQADVLGTLALAFGGIVGAYTGFAVLDTVNKRNAEARAGLPNGKHLSAEDRADLAASRAPAREGD